MTIDVDVVRAVYEAFVERDIEQVLALVDPECVITQDPALPWGGRYVGHDGLGAFTLALTGTIDSVVTTDALFAADGEVIQSDARVGRVAGHGTLFDIPEVHRWTVRDGKVVAAHFAIDTPAMLQALGAALTLRWPDMTHPNAWSTTSSVCSTRTRPSTGCRSTDRRRCDASTSRSSRGGGSARWSGAWATPSWCCCTAVRRTPTHGTPLPWPCARHR